MEACDIDDVMLMDGCLEDITVVDMVLVGRLRVCTVDVTTLCELHGGDFTQHGPVGVV
jgi:hypothetical protein